MTRAQHSWGMCFDGLRSWGLVRQFQQQTLALHLLVPALPSFFPSQASIWRKMIGISGETKPAHKWIIWSNQTSTQNLFKMMTSDLETCNWNNMIASLSLEWWFYIRWLPEWADHQTNIQIKFHHIIKNATNSYNKFWYLCWTIKQHQSMEHSMCESNSMELSSLSCSDIFIKPSMEL